ncbi:hypothetical protein GIS00_18060 [Nakamurella sp. YIM 132087]|uniref:Right handed beta helix domain-containing protein n=1 Tax=Nakamurella alba TaxID=2665158 RepID=A0A7K1FRH7_9ACTN|nr:hypothetical protein [Nakamurella alba]
MAPGNRQGSCREDDPCTVGRAFADLRDHPDSASGILLTAGDYGVLEIAASSVTEDGRVLIGVADGADVSIDRLNVLSPNTTWTGITVTGVLYLRPSAVGTILDGVTVEQGGLFVRSGDTVVRNSVFRDGSSLDGIQIGNGASGVRIENNVIRDYNQQGDTQYHSDCIQVFDASDVTIVGNRIANCSNAGIILSHGSGKGIDGLVIESNWVQGCVVRGDACRGGSALDIRESSAVGMVVRNNTVLNGSVRIGTQPDAVFDRNIIDYLSSCDSAMTNTIVQRWNPGLCSQPDALGSNGNRMGEVPVADAVAGDLTPTDPASVLISPVGGEPAAAGIDGSPLPADVAGASAG